MRDGGCLWDVLVTIGTEFDEGPGSQRQLDFVRKKKARSLKHRLELKPTVSSAF